MQKLRPDQPLPVAFVALGAYPLFDPTVRGPMGGMESRAWIFARALSRMAGMDVSFMVIDRGQPPVRDFDGITVYSRRNSILTALTWVARSFVLDGRAMRRVPFFHVTRGFLSLAWRIPGRTLRVLLRIAEQALRGVPAGPTLCARLPAEVFLTFGVNDTSAEVIAACRRNQRKSILCVAHDSDLDEVFVTPSGGQRADGVPARDGHLALTQADEIVVQSRAQLTLLRERFGRSGRLVLNPIDLHGDDTQGRPLESDAAAVVARGPYVLWVGRSDRVFKRPDVCFELARKLPTVRFVMVMALADAAFHAELKRDCPANVDLIDGLPFHAMPHLFRSSLLLVSTSAQEGFPNTFLQAGKYGIPVVSLNVDPAGMLATHGAGIACQGSLDKMSDAVQQLVADAGRRQDYAARLAAYAAAVHGLEGRVDELHRVIVESVQGPDECGSDRRSPAGGADHQPSGRAAALFPGDDPRQRAA